MQLTVSCEHGVVGDGEGGEVGDGGGGLWMGVWHGIKLRAKIGCLLFQSSVKRLSKVHRAGEVGRSVYDLKHR